MTNLKTKYGPLTLNSPLVAGSSGLTDSEETIRELEKYGAGAIVLKSVFEEEILREMKAELNSMSSSQFLYPESLDFYDYHDAPKQSTSAYLELIANAKKQVQIPVIASINCMDAEYWTYFPKQIEAAGADALELNIFNLPSDLNHTAEQNEKVYFDIIKSVQKQIHIPVFVKLSYYSSRLAAFLRKIDDLDVAGLILFNRFYNPDIDIDTEEITSGAILSNPGDIYNSLRWIAIMTHRVKCSLIASTGVHSGADAIKMLLAGASAVQVTSALYKNGISWLGTMQDELTDWMEKKGYKGIEDFRGKLSQENSTNPAVYARVQFMKYFRGFDKPVKI